MRSNAEFVIRRGTERDIADIAAFNINMAMETEQMVLDRDTITAGVSAMIAHPERGFYLVIDALSDSDHANIVASLMITYEWSDWRNGLFWWIQSVYVLPEWRRKKLYQSLYHEVKNLAAKAQSVCGFRLYVERENTIAQSTYKSLGMECTHYFMFEELYGGSP